MSRVDRGLKGSSAGELLFAREGDKKDRIRRGSRPFSHRAFCWIASTTSLIYGLPNVSPMPVMPSSVPTSTSALVSPIAGLDDFELIAFMVVQAVV